MYENDYSTLLPDWNVSLINCRAMQMGFRRDELDDVQQQIVPHLLNFTFDPAKSNGASEQTAIVAVIDQQLKTMARAQVRYRKHVEQFHPNPNVKGADDDLPAAVYEESPDLKLDVQLAIEALSPRDREICTALSKGHSIAQIARDLGCDRYIVRCAVRDIRSRFQAIGLEGWLSH